LIVGIAGGSGCGKTTLANRVVGLVGSGVAVISTDDYYRTLNEEDHRRALEGEINFDRPEALAFDHLLKDLSMMKSPHTQWPMMLPSYDFVFHQRTDASVPLTRPRAILVEGLFVLSSAEIRELLDVRLFARDDVDTCLVQRLRRDVDERNIAVAVALAQYERYVKPAFDAIVNPSSVHADLVIPNATRNVPAAEVVAGWILNRTMPVGTRCQANAISEFGKATCSEFGIVA